MYSWVAFPLLRITLLFAAGIMAAVEFPFPASRFTVLSILLAALVLYIVIWWKYHWSKFFSYNLIFGIAGHVLVFLAGYTSLLYHNDSLNEDHILYAKNISAYQILVKDQPDVKEKTIRVEGQIISTRNASGWNDYSGKLYVYIRKDRHVQHIAYGDVLLIKGSPDLTQDPKNPGEFDYKRFLSFQNIYQQDFVEADEYRVVSHNQGNILYGFALKSSTYLKGIIYKHVHSERERAIAMALLLGTKDELTSEINQAYSSAGAMHILAVSGLHVGIIYGLILFFFKKFQKRKHIKWIFLIAMLTGLWSYAMLTGLSASVLRAVTMFSLMTIANVTNREGNIYNTLSAAGLILLCVNPYLIMSVGFQLSFLAVFGIVHITPKIYHLFSIDQYLLDKMWMITSVSIAAQVATAPLVLLYFHQFPTYFFISNLIVIPAAFLILVTGIVLFVLDFVPYLDKVIGQTLEGLIYVTNEFVFLIERIPYNTIDNLYIDTYQSLLIILGVVFLMAWIYYKKVNHLVLACTVMMIFILISEVRAYRNIHCKEVVFYSIAQHSTIDLIQGDQGLLIADSILLNDENKMRFYIKPKRLRAGIKTSYTDSPNDFVNRKKVKVGELIVWNGLRILHVKELMSHLINTEVDVVLTSNNVITEIDQLTHIKSKYYILDGTNSRYIIDRLIRQNTIGHGLTMINLLSEGAYSISL